MIGLWIQFLISVSVWTLPADIAGTSLSDVRSCPWCAAFSGQCISAALLSTIDVIIA